MRDSLYVRLGGICALAVLGVGLAIGGNALGIGASAGDADAVGEFRLSEKKLTLSTGSEETTTVRNLSHTERVEISAESGVVKVETEHRKPLTAAQRERAARIARNNETIQQYIATAENYTFTVEPVQKIDATAVNSVGINETRREMNPPNDTVTGNDSFVIVESTEQTDNDDTVAVAREPKYAADIVSVRLSGPDSNPRFSLRINIETERIVDITDWVDIRNNQTND